jgi:di/tripeptidase
MFLVLQILNLMQEIFFLEMLKDFEMRLFMTTEWTDKVGLASSELQTFLNKVEDDFKERNYGSSINEILIVLNCLGHDVKHIKRYKKDSKQFTFYISIDYSLLVNAHIDQKMEMVRIEMVHTTNEIFGKRKFDDFDMSAYLADFKNVVESTVW